MHRLREVIPNFAWLSNASWNTALFAGFIGAIVAIPQAITFSYLVGVPIDHGLICAVVVSLTVAVFGNSILLSGPNTATAIMLGLSATELAARTGLPLLNVVMKMTLLVGAIQLVVWAAGAVKVFQLLSKSAISGITMAVGVLIIRSALNSILGKDWLSFDYGQAAVGAVTVAVALAFEKRLRKSWVLLAMASGMLVAYGAGFEGLGFLKSVQLNQLSIGWGNLGNFSYKAMLMFLPSAGAVAIISLAQSMVIAQDLKNRLDEKISLSRESFALGLGNLVAPLFGAYAGSGSFNRTQVNEEMGAKTPATGIVCALFCLLFVTFAGSVLSWVPVAVVAGVLFVVGYKMIKLPLVRKYFRSKEEGVTFSLIFVVSLSLGIAEATAAALLVSFYFSRRKKA